MHMHDDDESNFSDSDTPRIAQWEPDEGFEDQSLDSELEDLQEGSSNGGREPGRNVNLSSLSFGSLRKAHETLDTTKSEDDSDDSEDDTISSVESGEHNAERQTKNRETKVKKPEKRTNKNAPVEVSSKRPVSRKRQVVEVKKTNYRDPRFAVLSGDYSPEAFHKRYGFLTDIHKSELSTLKENLKRARTMLRSSPRDQREAREEEVENLERALKRTESQVNRDTREEVERAALQRAKNAENEQRKQGKGAWYMKSSAKKEVFLRARHDALAGRGGNLAVRKAIEKRQKKISQKDKKRRPSFASHSADSKDGPAPRKRRRV